MKCPHCGAATRLFKNDGDVVKMRAPIVIFKDDSCVVPCPKCKEEIQVPVTLKKADLPTETPLVISSRRLTSTGSDP